MNKSILVLDENSVIHGLVTSALETEGVTLHHEFNPGKFVERANSLMPDLILLGNSEQDPEYDLCQRLKGSQRLAEVPLVLLAGSKESLTGDQLSRLQVAGVVRKPFEAGDLQQQVSKHLNLVDLIGSAYEYRRSQSALDEGENPLAKLDVLDDEVLGLLHGAGTVPTREGAAPGAGAERPAASVVDDEVLAETLQPERAFEMVDETPAATRPQYDSLETLEGEFPSEPLEVPGSEAELDELGAADVLEEETAEETVFEPQGFDQELDGGERPAAAAGALDEIEVELPDDGVDARALESELDEGAVDLFESDLAEEPAPTAGGGEYEESIPLSVRRMMELKPVFTMTQEETAEGAEEPEPFAFDADSVELDEIQTELESMEAVDLDEPLEEEPATGAPEPEPPVQEQPLEFASEQDVRAMEERFEDELEPPEEFDLEAGDEAAASLDEDAGELEAEEMEAGEIEDEFAESLAAETAAEAEPAPEPPPQEPPTAEHPRETLAAGAVPSEPTVEAVTDGGEEDEDDFFVEEYLGEDEIDEEQIIAAEEDELEDAPELTPEDEAELDELLAEDEHLADMQDMEESLLAGEGEDLDEDIELEDEEEALIHSSLESERGADGAAAGVESHEEPLFERNFNALEEEAAAPQEDAGAAPDTAGSDEGETWSLEERDGGFAIADEGDEEALAEAEPEALEAAELEAEEVEVADLEDEELEPVDLEEPGEVITLHAEARDADEEELEEVPASALEEIDETAGEEPREAAEQAAAPAAEDEESVSIEFGEGEPGVFGEEEDEKAWKPEAPPGFVSQPAEEFPEDVVREPFQGPQGQPLGPEPPPTPRHTPEEVLEDPDSGSPVLSDEDELAAAGESTAADLADHVQPEELDLEEAPHEPLAADDEFAAHPSLSVLADDALGEVVPGTGEEPAALEAESAAEDTFGEEELASELGEELEPISLEEEDADVAFEPIDELEAAEAAGEEEPAPEEPGAEVTRGEVDALLGEDFGTVRGREAAQPEEEEPFAEEALEEVGAAPGGEGEEDLEDLLGAGYEDAGAEAETEELAGPAGQGPSDPEFDSLFASLRDEIAANPEGERLDDVLRNERIRDRIAELDFSLPQHENTFARAMGIYAVPGDGDGPTDYPAALGGAPGTMAPPQEAPPAEPSPAGTLEAELGAGMAPAGVSEAVGQAAADVSALSLLDPDIRAKLGQVLDEIISISVRKAVQEEMPKLMERMSKDA